MKTMKSLGYTAYKDGVCFGVSCLSVKSYFSQELDKFGENLNTIHQIFAESLENSIKVLKLDFDKKLENELQLEFQEDSQHTKLNLELAQLQEKISEEIVILLSLTYERCTPFWFL